MFDRLTILWRSLLARRRAERELDEELQFHVDMETRANLDRGMDAVEARRAALRGLGGVDQAREAVRDQRAAWWDPLMLDLRHAARGLLKAPAFTAAVVATMAIGIGGSTLIFSVVEALLLRPLPYRAADRLATVTPALFQWSDFETIRSENRSFSDTAAYSEREANLFAGGQPERGRMAAVSPNLFAVLGVKPVLGRSFEERHPRAADAHVAIVSHAFWRRRLAASPAALGQTLVIDHHAFTIIGVLPPGFKTLTEMEPGRESAFRPTVQVFVPVSITSSPDDRRVTGHWQGIVVIGRLKDGIAFDRARLDVERLANGRNLRGLTSASGPAPAFSLQSVRQAVTGDLSGRLMVLSLAVGLLLVAACGNVANLLVERLTRRQSELALRAALGASASQLARTVLSEMALVVGAGGAGGCLLAWGGVRLVHVYGTPVLGGLSQVQVNPVVLGFAFVLSALTALPIGAVLIVRLTRSGVGRSLRIHAGEPRMGGRLSTPTFLVVDQMALSVVLVVVGTLLARDLASLMKVDLGYEPDGVWMADIGLDHLRYYGNSAPFFADLLDKLSGAPGVSAAAVALCGPEGPFCAGSLQLEGSRPESGEGNDVSEHYFQVMSIPLLAGRGFTADDSRPELPPFIVNEAFARSHWGSPQAAVGKRITFGNGAGHAPARTTEIVGVVADSLEMGAARTVQARTYTLFRSRERFAERMTVLVKSRLGAAAVAGALSDAVRQLDAQQPVGQVLSVETVVAARYARQRLVLVMMIAFAGLTLMLAAVGINGVVAYAAALRRQEIGVRRALGATGGSVVRLFALRAVRLIAMGTLAGLPIALALRWLAVVEWVASDESDWGMALAGVGLVALAGVIAALIPAWRASRLDPMEALRCE